MNYVVSEVMGFFFLEVLEIVLDLKKWAVK